MLKEIFIPRLNLQLFADGGADGGATSSEGASGVSVGAPSLQQGVKNPLADVKYGIQDEQEAQTTDVQDNVVVDRNAEFEKLIKGEYKDLYDARVQDTIQKRLKNTKEKTDKYDALAPTLDILARKYGLKDVSDIEALNKAIEEDDAYYEEEALEKGITVEQLKSIRKMERENESLKRQMQEASVRENADRIYAKWMEEASNLSSVYPGFDLNQELTNPRFADLLKNNIDVRTAYEVIHKDEIIPAAMQFTARQVEQKLTNKIISAGARPIENGINSQSSAISKSDVAQLTKEDRQEIARRVAMGDKIRF